MSSLMEESREAQQHSVVAVIMAALRKSLVTCSLGAEEVCSSSMEIGRPTDVRHVSHVTFDRFHGFLGLPIEFQPQVPRHAPSARCVVCSSVLGFLLPDLLDFVMFVR